MSFLAPLFLLGGLAVALPVLFHLIRRTSRERMPFSSLMFLQPTPPRVTRRSRLDHILLLVLRSLVICLLAVGFARPFFKKPVAAEPASSELRRVVVLVDRSASMQRADLWTAAQAAAARVLRELGPQDQATLATFDRDLQPLLTFEQWVRIAAGDRSAVAVQRLAELKPGWGATHLASALIGAADLLEEVAAQDAAVATRRQVVLISDLQEGARLEGLQGHDWPQGVSVRIEPIKARRPTNAGVHRVLASAEAPVAGAPDEVKVRVSNAAESRKELFRLRWDGPEAATNQVEAYVPPGQSRVVTAPARGPVAETGRLLLSGDDEDFDNALFVVAPPPQRTSILFLGNEREDDPAQLLFYARRAWQNTRQHQIELVVRGPGDVVDAQTLAATSLVLISDTVSAGQTAAVARAIEGGKTALLVMKTPASGDTLSRLVGVATIAVEEMAAAGRYAMLAEIDLQHPLFAPFADARFGDFTKVHFWKHRRLPEDAVPRVRVLAKFDDGSPAFLEIPRGRGSLLVLASGWQPSDSQLALSSKFVPLLYSMLELAGGVRSQPSEFRVGDAVDVFGFEGVGQPPTLMVRQPDGVEQTVARGQRFTLTDVPGIYTVPGVSPAVRFAVNVAPEESRTVPMAVEDLAHLGVPLAAPLRLTPPRAAERRLQEQVAELENRQKLWRWLIVAVLVVLVTETWLAGRAGRQATVPAGSSV